MPGTPVPGPLPSVVAEPMVDGIPEQLANLARDAEPVADETHRKLNDMDRQLRVTAEAVERLNSRVVGLEEVLGQLFLRIEPMRRVWRILTGRHRLPPSH